MSEVKWTDGPWCISSESPGIIKRDLSDIGSEHGVLIASTMGRDDSGFYASESEANANAHLIAAAPDLFEALCDMVSDRESLSEATVQFAKRALAKAKGEQQ